MAGAGGDTELGLGEQFRSRLTSDRAGESSTLVASKLAVPPPHRNAIRRPRNERLLSAGLDRPLVLVAAPAGYGKTTLVTSWLATVTTEAAWVSLGPDDDDLERFWAYVTTAFARVGVLFDATDARRRLPALGNALAELGADLVLVLDDYHCITTPEIDDDIAALVEMRLPRFHLMLLTRSDPSFVRSRWKANGDMLEIRARQLAFDDDEMALFLDDKHVTLSPDVRSALFTRVNGWPAALRLVTLWIKGQHDAEAAVAAFASSDDTISDYLVTEVLAQLPGRLRRFLTHTSVLSDLTGALCDALTGRTDGAEMLDEIERQDLFVQALDQDRTWVRYHPLFQELLLNALRRSEPHEVAQLHRRACTWLSAHGFAEDAIKHGVLAQDWATVRILMLAETLAIGTRYPATTVEGWLSELPPEVLGHSPFFQLLLGYVLATTGNLVDARRALDSALVTPPAVDEASDLPELVAIVHAIRGGIARLNCDLGEAQRCASAVTRELAQRGTRALTLAPMARAISDTALAGALFWHGDLDRAVRLLDTVVTDSTAHHLHRMRVNAESCRALLLASTGRLRAAHSLALQVLESAKPLGVADLFQTSPAHLTLAIAAFQRGDPVAAAHELSLVLEHSRRHGDRGPYAAAATLRARLLADEGQLTAAFGALADARSAWPDWTMPAALQAGLAAEEARLSLIAGDTGAARAIAARWSEWDLDVPAARRAKTITEARLVLAAGDPAQAATMFTLGAEIAVRENDLPAGVEMLAEAAAAADAAAEPHQALCHLDRALELAEDEDILAPFLARTDTMRALLLRMRTDAGSFPRAGFRRRLLERLGPPQHASVIKQAPMLSERELTVLHLLGGPLRNGDIAARLNISPNTLKTHVRNVYRKLDVDDREQVRVRAKALGLI